MHKARIVLSYYMFEKLRYTVENRLNFVLEIITYLVYYIIAIVESSDHDQLKLDTPYFHWDVPGLSPG